MISALALLAFVVPGAVIALIFVTRVQAIFASAVVTAVIAVVAGMLHVVTDIPIAALWGVLMALVMGTIFSVPVLRSRAIRNARGEVSRMEYLQLAAVVVLVIFVVAFVPAPLAWDARSIWLFHASWLNGPAQAFLDGQTLAAIAWSHPNYPLIGPASMAVTWGLAGGAENLVLGVQAIALLTILVVALSASLAMRAFAPTGNPLVKSLAFIFYLTSVLTISDGLLNQGYMDPLQAAFIVSFLAALMPMLSGKLTWSASIFAGIIGVGAMSVKQEGFWFTMTVVVVMLVVSLRSQYWAKYLPLAAMLLFYGVWKAFLGFAQSLDTSDATGMAGRLPELVDRSSLAWGILVRIARQEATAFALPALAIMVIFLILFLVITPTRLALKQAAALALIWCAIMAIIVLTYALGNTRDQIDWWLSASFSRIIGTCLLVTWFTVYFVVLRISPLLSSSEATLTSTETSVTQPSTQQVS
jgi:hypothetical protein